MNTQTDYQAQAEKFLSDTKTTFKAVYSEYRKYFPDDKECRSVYRITLRRKGHGSYTFNFGQSIANSGQEPTPYNVLACLTKYDVGTFENFCSEFGYDTDSIKATKIYKAVVNEYKNVQRLFGDVIEQLAEIQ